jgi:hypothetical protein
MNWLFYLDDTLIDEPIGFSDIALRIKRDSQWHGIFFEATTSDLQFYGDGAAYLINKKRTEGFAADVTFKAIVECGEPDEIFEGKLDFRQYKEKCGNSCFVVIPVEQEGCIMTLRNRYDQKVDISNQVAFDKLTVLPNYDGLNFGMELAAQDMQAMIEGYSPVGGEVVDMSLFPDDVRGKQYAIRPDYSRAINQSIQTSQLTPIVQLSSDNGLNDSQISPVLLLEGLGNCYDNNLSYEGRLKGSISICLDDDGGGPNASFDITVQVAKGNSVPFTPPYTVLHTVTIFDGIVLGGYFDFDFDLPFSGTTELLEGEGFFTYVLIDTNSDTAFCDTVRTVTFDPETYIIINSLKSCPPTDALVSLIHETASRVTEAITDRCLTVKSDYYGRTDSEPYAAAEDGCGSLRTITNGLRLRNAENPLQFISLKDIFDGLNAIDNIGMGVELGTVYEPDVLRIEPVEYFYQDVKIAEHPAIPLSSTDAKPDLAYSIIKVGYKKWETENENGLDEFNSNKEFRTSLKSIDNTLDITSGFIGGGYPIEHTRQQSFADTGAADNKYDNDNFIICVERSPYAYGNYIVEQGITGNPANFYSPETAYNWRIRPLYNLMRWWKSIAQSYVNLSNSSSKLFFASGVGNFLASGELAVYNDCKLESIAKAENDYLTKNDMVSGNVPLWYPDEITYKYPLSLSEYNVIKAAPLGYIYAQCGSGDFVKGFITNLVYRVAKGEADITLRLKWDTQ